MLKGINPSEGESQKSSRKRNDDLIENSWIVTPQSPLCRAKTAHALIRHGGNQFRLRVLRETAGGKPYVELGRLSSETPFQVEDNGIRVKSPKWSNQGS